MKATVKILKNRAERERALQQNENNIMLRDREMSKPEDERSVFLDVSVPEPEIEETPLYLDAGKIELAHELDNGMIAILYMGRDFQLVKTDELMRILELRFDEMASNKESFLLKQN